jgi:hypothetical protein
VEDGAGVDDEPGHRVPPSGCRSVTTLPLRPFVHDAYHCAELYETAGIAGLPQVDLWD